LRCTTSPRHKRRQGFSTLLYTGTASGDGTAPMNGLGSLPADANEVHEENEDHTGCI
jgi:hypothetical protein